MIGDERKEILKQYEFINRRVFILGALHSAVRELAIPGYLSHRHSIRRESLNGLWDRAGWAYPSPTPVGAVSARDPGCASSKKPGNSVHAPGARVSVSQDAAVFSRNKRKTKTFQQGRLHRGIVQKKPPILAQSNFHWEHRRCYPTSYKSVCNLQLITNLQTIAREIISEQGVQKTLKAFLLIFCELPDAREEQHGRSATHAQGQERTTVTVVATTTRATEVISTTTAESRPTSADERTTAALTSLDNVVPDDHNSDLGKPSESLRGESNADTRRRGPRSAAESPVTPEDRSNNLPGHVPNFNRNDDGTEGHEAVAGVAT
ncbi:hypothetical protein WN51_13421 [Melipona quadrifasciata]|uniref:Uncharacterized protein n=1 Tax=Melipona quadrifasciata TaxID=166423 RepID=A0A0N0BGV9_9HYME|nr:hypothetical protein WN51_13421 [Melipona quadrifasciata]